LRQAKPAIQLLTPIWQRIGNPLILKQQFSELASQKPCNRVEIGTI